jgi:hypothetical protein
MLKEFKYYGLTDKYMGSMKELRAEELRYLKEKQDKEQQNVIEENKPEDTIRKAQTAKRRKPKTKTQTKKQK